MEWCRMFSLRLVVCTLLLGCGLCYPASNSTSKREQKRQELLKMLGGYSPTHAKVLSPVENTLDHEKHDLTHPSLPKTTENPRLPPVDGEESSEESVKFPDTEDISTYRDYMERIYGTQEGIDFLKKNYGPTGLDRARARFGKKIYREPEEVRLANAHYRRMAQKTRCRTPKPQLVRVRDFYPDPSKDYAPECTILHRCSDTTGCCAKGLHCVPTDVQEVALHFFDIHPGKTETVRLLFENHTSCECRPINDMPRLQEDDGNHLLDRKDPHSRCQECPVPFSSRTYKDGRCGCDCFDRQRPCLRIKRGKDPLPDIERRCVEAHHCHIPECEHGPYDPESGRCPPRHDEAPPRKHHSRHRWAMAERD